MRLTLAVGLFCLAGFANSECNFPTGDYINELADPSHIKQIDIEIPKSSKFARNAFKIFSSKSKNIPAKLKKTFKADIFVTYDFGFCKYPGKVRQSGDLRDHIKLLDGQPIQSLDVKLHKGNIINAIKFKLLIPETRRGKSEILASVILKQLGFITPETFEVKTTVNGVKSVMLFQEKAAKELLERNTRREGPIFEGDESLLWSHKEYENFELEPMALARLTNVNWFDKGSSSRGIVLEAASKIQGAYLEYGKENLRRGLQFAVFPNTKEDQLFVDYHSILLAMNGSHGLRPHNRKYYYNVIESKFEPIYYDGDVDFGSISNGKEAQYLLPFKPTNELLNRISLLGTNDNTHALYSQRVIKPSKNQNFFGKSLSQFKGNFLIISNNALNNNMSAHKYDQVISVKTDWYTDFQNRKNVAQLTLTEIVLNDGNAMVTDSNKNKYEVSHDDLSDIFSKNQWNGKRVTYIPSKGIARKHQNIQERDIANSKLKMSSGMKVLIEHSKKLVKFVQSTPNDWAIISGGELNGWKIVFVGMPYVNEPENKSQQRFNQFGLTGCLTIYKSVIHDTSFNVTDGGCEDSINILNSAGDGVVMEVINAHSDAIDFDYSSISLKQLDVINAGNDCFDVSGGEYRINYAFLRDCQDKGISIGEKSNLVAGEVLIGQANIAISAKDLSKVKVDTLNVDGVNICVEVKRKKQEFGGAHLVIDELKCSSTNDIDNHSKFEGIQQ